MTRSLQLLTISIFLLLILPWIIQDGMFMDGMIYATVARNLSLGIGSWWHLHLTNYLSPQYFDQPPLTIWITSFFFKLFGYSMYTERIYSFTAAVINLLLIKVIWQKINIKNPKYKEYWWLPVLLWIIPPACFWSFTNNMEENTMSIFILSSVYFMLNAIQNTSKKYVSVLLMATSIFLAAMCKGIQGTFTAIGFIAYYVAINRNYFMTIIKFTSIIAITLALFSSALIFYQPARDYFIGYYHTRILSTFTNPGTATTDNRFYLLFRLISELLLPILICVFILLYSKKSKVDLTIIKENKKYSLLFLLIALAGTLPLLVTAEQRRFYLVPTFPFYALAFSFLVVEQIHFLFDKFKSAKLSFAIKCFAILLLCTTIVLTLFNFGTAKRDKEMLSDVYKIGKIVPENSSIAIDGEIFKTWVLHLYFQRYYGISLNPTETNVNCVFHLTKGKDLPVLEFEKMDLGLKSYNIFKKQ